MEHLKIIIYISEVIIGITGFILGVFVTNVKKSHGVLKIDKSDPEKDSYLFEIDNLDEIEKVRWVRLKIVKIKNE